VDAGARRRNQSVRERPAGLTHLRQPRNQKALCRDRAWLSKVRPWYGHDYHFHVRIVCPKDSPNSTSEPPIVTGDGCSGRELDRWFTDAVPHPRPSRIAPKEKPPLRMADLPAAYRQAVGHHRASSAPGLMSKAMDGLT
jgi:penicillin-insensitive murein endopeptidase